MKKIVSTILVSALALSLCACSSTQPTQETTKPLGQKSVDAVNVTTSEVLDGTQETTAQYQVYSLEGMSAEDIFSLLKSFTVDITTGSTLNDYPSRFGVEPFTSNVGNGFDNCYWFFGSENAYCENRPENLTNYLGQVSVRVQNEMDGTITIMDYSCVNVILVLNDYNVASSLYDQIYNYLVQVKPTSNFTDHREGTTWGCDDGVNNANGSIYMEKKGTDYQMIITLPLA